PQRPAAAASFSTRSGVSMKLAEDDFIPSEEWFGKYMGEQGLRYALNKTPDEVEKEGDYSLLEKLFGQTSNNKAQMDLKAQVLAKANIPTNPERYKEWTAKYGYGRFFPMYVDKSGRNDEPTSSAAPKVAAAAQNVVKAAKSAVSTTTKTASKATAKAKAKTGFSIDKPAPKKPEPKKAAAAPSKPMGNIKNLPKAL
ncbi:unnamed protein product, partial [Ascophyllum nodosum]